jgi:hypothetical protein
MQLIQHQPASFAHAFIAHGPREIVVKRHRGTARLPTLMQEGFA